MQNNKVSLWIGILIAIVIAIGSWFVHTAPDGSVSFGNTTPGTRFPHGISIGNPAVLGTNPTNLAKFMFGTCALISSNFTVPATSTVPMDCAITGVASTDGVFAQFATSTATTYGGWQIRGASASTTAGFITISVVNGTGASATIPSGVASTTKYIILGAQ